MPDPKKDPAKADAPDRVPPNPPRGKFHELQDDLRRYRVQNTTMLGPHREGAVVSAIDLGPGVSVERLKAKGVLVELPEDEALEYPGDGTGRVSKGVAMPFVPPPPPEKTTGNIGGGALIGDPANDQAKGSEPGKPAGK